MFCYPLEASVFPRFFLGARFVLKRRVQMVQNNKEIEKHI